jgi:hypothetical protein
MRQSIQRKTVYAATLITVLALAGAWTFAATLVTSNPPSQSSGITVIAPQSFTTATVQSTELVAVTDAIAATAPAGTQASPGAGGLNSSQYTNAVLPTCSGTPNTCGGNYSAVDVAHALAVGDIAVQVSLHVQQGAAPVGFDVQVELVLAGTPLTYVFGNGYFDTGTNTAPTTVWVMLFIDTGVSALTPPSLDNVVVTMNACVGTSTTGATTCP